MKTKTLLTVFGLLNIAQGAFMFLNGKELTKGVFQNVGEEALMVGEQMHMPLGTAFIGVGFILLICRDIDFDASKEAFIFLCGIYWLRTFTSVVQSFSRES